MILTEIISCVSKFAPVLGTVLSGGNPLVGVVISLIAHAFNADPTDPIDIVSKITNSADAQEKLKLIEANHQNQLTLSNSQDFSTAATDRESARNFWETEQKITGKLDWLVKFVTVMLLLGFFAVIILLIVDQLNPQSDHDVLFVMLGYLGASFRDAVNFCFGDSK